MDIPRIRYEILHELVTQAILSLDAARASVARNGAGSLATKHNIVQQKDNRVDNMQDTDSESKPDAKKNKLGTQTSTEAPCSKTKKPSLSLKLHTGKCTAVSVPVTVLHPNSQKEKGVIECLLNTSTTTHKESHNTHLTNTTTISNKTSISKAQNQGKKSNYCCELCHKKYQYRTGLLKHMRKIHPETKKQEGNITCRESMCLFQCRTLADLRNHLQCVHNIDMDTEELQFRNQEGTCNYKALGCICFT